MESIPSSAHGIIREFYEALDCPRSLTCWLLYSYGEHRQLVGLEFNPLDYNSMPDARDSLSATKFLSKAKFLKTDIDLKKVAMDSFFKAEEQCRLTNERILRSRFKNAETSCIMSMMQFKIGCILGDIDPEELVDACNWGPGATTSIRRRDATHPTKFQTGSEITSRAYDFVAPWFSTVYPHWVVEWKIQEASKVVTVAKSAKTDRTIAIEPDLNLWFQKGIGRIFRRRLLRAGIDLNTQEHNASRARVGSRFSNLATIDFSAASDTIAKELVYDLFPRDWYNLCWAFRSSFALFDGQLIKLEKFSSMGNGFTFELETLIFFVLALACSEYVGANSSGITVFGDDVVLPSEAVDVFTRVSEDLGFSVNKTKSYSSSYYRESCGAHWWDGSDIKPIFLKEPPDGKTELLKLANNVRRLAHRRNSYGCDRSLRRCWQTIARLLGAHVPRISEGYGDIGLVENFDDPSVTATRAKHGVEGFYVRVWAVLAVQREFDHRGLHLTKLKAIGRKSQLDANPFDDDLSGIGNNIPLPGRTRHAKIRVLVPRWIDIGPWV